MSSNQIKSKERAIGKQAAKMAEAYIHQVLRQKLSIRNQGDDKNKPILDATKVKAKMGQHRLLGLNFTSSKVGFMLHYGFNGVREGGSVYLQAARYQQNSTVKKPHQATLKSYRLFENIYERSGALNYMITALGDTRTDDVIAKLSGLLLQLNTKDE
ncbi:hypothetical protein JM79_2773 [Gramella sp. Hel_I_59]|uniref:hypothetical protein n=1 Tax=Gramella sp. Hel_I_59 TaxID=1249978 RepID=UPI001154249E|nr:hypothetical protein [Gramella sp. Hel_I_59]TQI71824.1 hypothetical protein JM79_2773 [Gramella sp. Hel_I_59]